MKYSIPTVIKVQDGGDGGYSVYIYGSEQEMLDDHYDYKKAVNQFGRDSAEAQEVAKRILTEDDPYETGYISHGTVKFDVEGDVAKLDGKIYFHVGQ